MYARLVLTIGSKAGLGEADLPKLETAVGDADPVLESTLPRTILEASRMSMGADISDIDLLNVRNFARQLVSMYEQRISLSNYLAGKMDIVAPNLAALIGNTVGARLIAHAGSLTNLAKYPASTVQILGAEKALFRALKTRGKTPKYGLIYHSSFIGKADAKNKGRISRYLANKCSIASRIDCFSDAPSSVFGVALKSQVDNRVDFYAVGEKPMKNMDVMHAVLAKISKSDISGKAEGKKDKKKEKKEDKKDKKEDKKDKKEKKEKKEKH